MQFVNMSAKSFREMVKPKSKYHAEKTVVNGIEYDSKKESRRAIQLELMEKAGQIHNLQRQVSFELQEGFVNNEGKKIRQICYVADFVYTQDGQYIVEDSKGFRTKEYVIKKKLFQYKYPGYKFIES